MKKSFLFFAALAAILSLSSCKKDFTPTPESGQNETSRQPARITVSVQGAPVTKADIATRNNEDRLNTVEVYVFDAQTGSITNGMLESYKKAEDAEILGEQHNNAKVTFNATTGKKHIYVVANAGNNYAVTPAAALAQTIATEEEFLATISRFNENAIASGSVATSLLMVGGSENVLTQGENNIDISLRRLVARVKIEKITGGFTSPALQSSTFTVKKLYLVNVAKQAKMVNGDWSDVFGTESGNTALPDGHLLWPEGFIANGTMKYYKYAVPSVGDGNDGFWNWMTPANFVNGTTTSDSFLSTDTNVRLMTQFTTSGGEGVLYGTGANASHNYLPGKFFYAYPNASPAERNNSETPDYTTKLVIETEISVHGKTVTSFYPISIPYLQPNYAYTIENVTLTRLGSNNPFIPVTTAECTFSIVVSDWHTGVITGKYNNETTPGTGIFEI